MWRSFNDAIITFVLREPSILVRILHEFAQQNQRIANIPIASSFYRRADNLVGSIEIRCL